MTRVLEFFRTSNGFFRYVGLILANKGHYRKTIKNKLLADYLRLKLEYLLLPAFVRKRVKGVTFLGFDWEIFDFLTFMTMVENIFIEHEYFFTAKKRKPEILDLGCNIGMSILYFKILYPRGRIRAFEADPVTFGVLKRNIERNKLAEVKIENSAINNKDGVANFFVDDGPGSPLASLYFQRMPKRRIQVRSVRLSKQIKTVVDFMKMDIEGAEGLILDDLYRSGLLTKIDQMVVEYHHHIEREKDQFSKFLSKLEKGGFGYQVCAEAKPPFVRGAFEDILVFGYRKNR